MSILLITAMLVLSVTAFADDLSSMSLEELNALRDERLSSLSEVNSAIGAIIKANTENTSSGDAVGKINEIFPDEQLAMYVRDMTGKLSIQQPVMQDELDTITQLYNLDYKPADLTGVSYLRNLNTIYFNGDVFGSDPLLIPDEICLLSHLEVLNLPWCDVASLPKDIGNIATLTDIYLEDAPISSLPESIGNLVNLTTLKLSGTKISSLPESIGNCTALKNLDISDTLITSLPDSIWNLTLDSINLSGTGIK